MNKSPIGRRLLAARRRAGLSLSQLAAASGVPISTIHAIELGESKNPGVLTLSLIAVALDVDLADLLGKKARP